MLPYQKQYQSFFSALRENEQLCPHYENQEISGGDVGGAQAAEDRTDQEGFAELTELTEEEFDQLLEQLEEAVYNFDESEILKIMGQLKECQYRANALNEIVEQAVRKVKKMDYMSALELVIKQKKHLMGEEK